MPEISFDRLARQASDAARDALYVTVGFGVLAFQRAQVRRHELREQFDAQLQAGRAQVEQARSDFDSQFKVIDERLSAVEARLDAVLDQVQDALPTPAGELLSQARDAARAAGAPLRDLMKRQAA
jgi:ElaB/YqjD/DUF883 family membrane-anchored ribosome-binding protein